jgi:hypothetical protein
MKPLPHPRTSPAAAHTRALVVVDLAVDGWQGLLEGLDHSTVVLVLQPHSHGLAQLGEHLRGLQAPLHSIHLMGHGRPGSLRLGSGELDLASLQTCAPQWQQIGHGLDAEGALVLYGCELAKGPLGRQFIAALAACVGAEVTASSRRVGAVALAGDRALDQCTGTAASAPALHPAAMAQQAGNDEWWGGAGNDVIKGGDGDDLLNNGAGADSVSFSQDGNGIDTIADFGMGDSIRHDGRPGYNAALPFVGAPTNLGLGQVYLGSAGAFTTLRIGTAAAPGADLAVKLTGDSSQSAFGAGSDTLPFTVPPPNCAPSGTDKTLSVLGMADWT